jgi:hypothetical protein
MDCVTFHAARFPFDFDLESTFCAFLCTKGWGGGVNAYWSDVDDVEAELGAVIEGVEYWEYGSPVYGWDVGGSPPLYVMLVGMADIIPPLYITLLFGKVGAIRPLYVMSLVGKVGGSST